MNKEDLDKLSDGELSQLITNLNDYGAFYHFDINNWADMGPLIDDLWRELMSCEGSSYITMWECFIRDCSCGKLRAAAIVYLLIHGGE